MPETEQPPDGFNLDAEASRADEAAAEGITVRNAPPEVAKADDELDAADEDGVAADGDDDV